MEIDDLDAILEICNGSDGIDDKIMELAMCHDIARIKTFVALQNAFADFVGYVEKRAEKERKTKS